MPGRRAIAIVFPGALASVAPMNRTCCHLTVFVALLAGAVHASPTEAKRIQDEFKLKMEAWTLSARLAATPEEQQLAMEKQPDAEAFARRMWERIGPSLADEWTLEPAAWFLSLAPSLMQTNADAPPSPIFIKEIAAIRAAVEEHHLNSPKIGPVCLELAVSADLHSLALLEKIASGNPDPQVQGVAALSAAMILKSLGDEPDIMRRRINHLRKAIIESADVEVSGTTVAKLAEDELYIILHLTKGRVAPDLRGVDSANRPMQLADHTGKVVVLLFWGSNVLDAERTVEMADGMIARFRGRPFALIGVNQDSLAQLRALQENGRVDWPNFSDPEGKLAAEYRVGSLPLAYVLDHERKIHYAGPLGSFVELTAEALLGDIRPAEAE
jgi:peroxiredoxin